MLGLGLLFLARLGGKTQNDRNRSDQGDAGGEIHDLSFKIQILPWAEPSWAGNSS